MNTDGNAGGGGTGAPITPWVKLTPSVIDVAVGNTPVQILPTWGNQTSTPTVSPGAIAVVNGAAFSVHPLVSTVYTIFDGTNSSTCEVNVGVPAGPQTRWLDVHLNFTEPQPTGSVVGFDVVIFTGSDPTNPATWLREPIRLAANDRRLITQLTLIPPLQINVAGRPVYEVAQRVAPWVQIAASLTFQ